MTEVKRKKGESFESMLRRFNTRILRSGRLKQAKKVRFLKPRDNKTKKKAAALKRKGMREKFEYLLRSGKLKESEIAASFKRR